MEHFSKPVIAGSTTTRGGELEHDPGLWARYTCFMLGAWLLLSAFVLSYAGTARANAAITGTLIALISLWAVRSPNARRADTVLASWLFFSTLALHRAPSGPAWNDILIAIATFVLSFVPSRTDDVHVGT